jgi:deoxyadenosine/deoxycytidine kinase
MLIEEKINYLKHYLSKMNDNYGDIIKSEMYINFFEFNTYSYDFLNIIETENEIKEKIEFVISKFILLEHEEDLNDIIYEYLL